MRKNWKKVLSMVLAASMVFSLNSIAFAGEIPVEDEMVVEDVAAAEEVLGAETDIIAGDVDVITDEADGAALEVAGAEAEVAEVEEYVALADTVSSGTISEDLISQNAYIGEAISVNATRAGIGDSYAFVISFNSVLQYNGQKHSVPTSKKAGDIYVTAYYAKVSDLPKSVSADGLANEEVDLNSASWNNLFKSTKTKVKVKSGKDATVSADGTPNYLVIPSKGVYISGITANPKDLGITGDDAKKFKADLKALFDKDKENLKKYKKGYAVSDDNIIYSTDGKSTGAELDFYIPVFPAIVNADGLDKNNVSISMCQVSKLGVLPTSKDVDSLKVSAATKNPVKVKAGKTQDKNNVTITFMVEGHPLKSKAYKIVAKSSKYKNKVKTKANGVDVIKNDNIKDDKATFAMDGNFAGYYVYKK